MKCVAYVDLIPLATESSINLPQLVTTTYTPNEDKVETATTFLMDNFEAYNKDIHAARLAVTCASIYEAYLAYARMVAPECKVLRPNGGGTTFSAVLRSVFPCAVTRELYVCSADTVSAANGKGAHWQLWVMNRRLESS